MFDGSTTYEFLEIPFGSEPISEPANTAFESELVSVEGDGFVPTLVRLVSVAALPRRPRKAHCFLGRTISGQSNPPTLSTRVTQAHHLPR